MVNHPSWLQATRDKKGKVKMVPEDKDGDENGNTMVSSISATNSAAKSKQPNGRKLQVETINLRIELIPNAGKNNKQGKEFIMETVNEILTKVTEIDTKMKFISTDRTHFMVKYNAFDKVSDFEEYFQIMLKDVSGRDSNNPHTVFFSIERQGSSSLVTELLRNKEIRDILSKKKAFLKEHKLPLGKVAYIGSIYLIPIASISIGSFEHSYNKLLKEYISNSSNGKFNHLIQDHENIVEFTIKQTAVDVEQVGEVRNLNFPIIDVRCTKGKGREIIDLIDKADPNKEVFGVFAQSEVKKKPVYKDLVVHHHKIVSDHVRITIVDITEEIMKQTINIKNPEGIEEEIIPLTRLESTVNSNNEKVISSIKKMDGYNDRWMVNTTKQEIELSMNATLDMLQLIMNTQTYFDHYGRVLNAERHILKPPNDVEEKVTKLASIIPKSIVTTNVRPSSNIKSSTWSGGNRTWSQVVSPNQDSGSPNSSVSNSSIATQVSILQENYNKLLETVEKLKGDVSKANETVHELVTALQLRDKQIEKMTVTVEKQMAFMLQRDEKYQQIASKGHMIPDNENVKEKRSNEQISKTPIDQTPSYVPNPSKQQYQPNHYSYPYNHYYGHNPMNQYHAGQYQQPMNHYNNHQQLIPFYNPGSYEVNSNNYPSEYMSTPTTNSSAITNPIPVNKKEYHQEKVTMDKSSLQQAFDNKVHNRSKQDQRSDSSDRSKTPIRGGSARKSRDDSEFLLDNSNISLSLDEETSENIIKSKKN